MNTPNQTKPRPISYSPAQASSGVFRTSRVLAAASLVLLAGLTFSCANKLPPEADSVLKAGLESLKSKNSAGFVAKFVPDQRSMSPSTAFAVRARYFLEVTGYKYEPKDIFKLEKDRAVVLVTLRYPKGYFGTFFMHMKKVSGKWYIDFKKSYEGEKSRNGAHAWQVMKFKK